MALFGSVDRGRGNGTWLDAATMRDRVGGRTVGPLGTPQEFVQSGQSLRGGMTLRRYRIKFPTKTLALTTFIMPDGKIEQYQIAAAE